MDVAGVRMSSSIEQAVILTQKSAPRFQAGVNDLPIALKRICSVPLIKRQLDGLSRSGIKSCVVVLGEKGELIRRTIETDSNIHMQIDWVDYRDWQTGEGNAVLKVREQINRE